MSENMSTHINLINIRAIQLEESIEFFDILFKYIGLNKKETIDDDVYYWGNFGLRLSEQKDILAVLEPRFKYGITEISIRVGSRELITNLFNELCEKEFKFCWRPKSFRHTSGYFSCCLLDPDKNKFEIVYMD